MLAAEPTPAAGQQAWPPVNRDDGTVWREISAPLAPFLSQVREFLEAQIA